jgi:hypothetical protein
MVAIDCACELAGVVPTYQDLNGHDANAFIVPANLARRNLSKGQQAMALAMIYPEPERGRGKQDAAKKGAETASFSYWRVREARSVLRHSRALVGNESDSPAATNPKPVEIRLDEAEPMPLRTIGGSTSDRFNNTLIDSMAKAGWFPPNRTDEDRARQLFVAVKGLQAFAPTDEIEAMIAAQAMAAHHASMECSRRAMLHEQQFESAQALRKAAAQVPHHAASGQAALSSGAFVWIYR